MIEKDGSLRCDGCGKKVGIRVNGLVEIYCPRCKRYNIFDSRSGYESHRVVELESLTKNRDVL